MSTQEQAAGRQRRSVVGADGRGGDVLSVAEDLTSAPPPSLVLRRWGWDTWAAYRTGPGCHPWGDFVAVGTSPEDVLSIAERERHACTAMHCSATDPATDDTRPGSGSVQLSVAESVKAKPGRQPRGLAQQLPSDLTGEERRP